MMQGNQQVDQQAYMQIQQLQQQIQQMQEHLEEVDDKLEEATELKKDMDDFKDLEPGKEILVPLANGIFAKAELKDTQNLKVNVGGQVVVGKSVDEAQELVDEQIMQLRKMKEQSEKQHEEMMAQAQKLAQKMQG